MSSSLPRLLTSCFTCHPNSSIANAEVLKPMVCLTTSLNKFFHFAGVVYLDMTSLRNLLAICGPCRIEGKERQERIKKNVGPTVFGYLFSWCATLLVRHQTDLTRTRGQHQKWKNLFRGVGHKDSKASSRVKQSECSMTHVARTSRSLRLLARTSRGLVDKTGALSTKGSQGEQHLQEASQGHLS